jgi:hypothetical protein
MPEVLADEMTRAVGNVAIADVELSANQGWKALVAPLSVVDSYRVEKQAAVKSSFPTRTRRSSRCRPRAGGHKADPEMDRLSNILETFNDQFGNIPWKRSRGS